MPPGVPAPKERYSGRGRPPCHSLTHRALLEACRAPAAVTGIRRRSRRRAELDNLSVYALLQPFPLESKYSVWVLLIRRRMLCSSRWVIPGLAEGVTGWLAGQR